MALEFQVPDLENMTWREIFALYDENFRKISAYKETLTAASIDVHQFPGGSLEYTVPEFGEEPAGFVVMLGDNLMVEGTDYEVNGATIIFYNAPDEDYMLTVWVVQGRDIVTGSVKYVLEIKELVDQCHEIYNKALLVSEELKKFGFDVIDETVRTWLEEHPELSVLVADKSITVAKLADETKEYIEGSIGYRMYNLDVVSLTSIEEFPKETWSSICIEDGISKGFPSEKGILETHNVIKREFVVQRWTDIETLKVYSRRWLESESWSEFIEV